jgi:predicted GIY-YIG superfamily endonuclease
MPVWSTATPRPLRPVILKCIEEFESVSDAIDRERQIKGWSRRKKQALIAGNYEALPALSRSKAEQK